MFIRSMKEDEAPQTPRVSPHHRTHTGEQPYKCDQCGRRFKKKCHLTEHIFIHTGRPHICKDCGRRFTRPSRLEQHRKVHTGERPHRNVQCGNYSGSLGAHKHIQHSKTPASSCKTFICYQCGKGFPSKAQLQIHQRMHRGKEPNRCKYCGRDFISLSYLKIHERRHTGEKPYKCDQCGRRFSDLSNCNSHKRSHRAEKPYNCDQCGRRFKKKSHLTEHIFIHTGRPHICKDCGRRFTRPSRLERHRKVHIGERPHRSDQCGNYSGSLGAHKHIQHSKSPASINKTLICDQCGKGFPSKAQLQIHQRMHRGKEPNRCKYCGRDFISLSYLKIHERSHTGEKPHKCDQCGERFSDPSNFNRHKRSHRAKKPYNCDENGHKQEHEPSLLEEKPFICEDCGTVVKVRCTALSNVFTLTNLSDVKCFMNNHTLTSPASHACC